MSPFFVSSDIGKLCSGVLLFEWFSFRDGEADSRVSNCAVYPSLITACLFRGDHSCQMPFYVVITPAEVRVSLSKDDDNILSISANHGLLRLHTGSEDSRMLILNIRTSDVTKGCTSSAWGTELPAGGGSSIVGGIVLDMA